MKGKWKNAAALLLVCALVLAMPAGIAEAWAATTAEDSDIIYEIEDPPDLDAPCSIYITIGDGETLEALQDRLVIDIYRVAYSQFTDREDKYQYAPVPIGPYQGVEDLYNVGKILDWGPVTQKLAEIALSGEDRPYREEIPLEWPEIDLEAGWYLIIPHGRDMAMDDYITTVIDGEGNESLVTLARDEENGYEYLFAPLLIALPERLEYAADENEDGKTVVWVTWAYENVWVSLKPDRRLPGIVTVHKKSVLSHKALPGATFKLYSTSGNLSSDFFTVNAEYQDGTPAGEVPLFYQGTYTTGSDGDLTLDCPDPGALYALVEETAPPGFKKLEEPIFFYINECYWQTEKGGKAIYSLTLGDIKPGSGSSSNESLRLVDGGFSDWTQRVAIENEGTAPVWVRIKAFNNNLYNIMFGGEGWEDGGDGYYYYSNILNGGETTSEWLIRLEPLFDAPEGGYEIPEMAIIYEGIPVQYNPDGTPCEAGWNRVPDEEGGEDGDRVEPKPKTYYIGGLGEDGSLTVYNDPLPGTDELPSTGGIGTTIFSMAGGMMLAGALILLAYKKRTQERSA